MCNTLKMEFYRAVKSISTWSILLAVMILSMVSLSLSTIEMDKGSILGEMQSQMEAGSLQSSEVVNNKTDNKEELSFLDHCENSIKGEFLVMFVAIFSAIFATGDSESGFLKSIFGNISKKYNLIVAKILVVSAFVFSTFLIVFIATGIGSLVFLEVKKFGDIGPFVKFLGVQFLLETSFGAIMVLIATIVRKTTVTLIIGIGYIAMIVQPLYSGINYVADKVFKVSDFAISKYLIYGNLFSVTTTYNSEIYTRAITVALISIALAVIISIPILNRQDVK